MTWRWQITLGECYIHFCYDSPSLSLSTRLTDSQRCHCISLFHFTLFHALHDIQFISSLNFFISALIIIISSSSLSRWDDMQCYFSFRSRSLRFYSNTTTHLSHNTYTQNSTTKDLHRKKNYQDLMLSTIHTTLLPCPSFTVSVLK